MKRLTQNNNNTPEEFERIFKKRIIKGVDWFDRRRWKVLLKYWKGGRMIDLGCLDSEVPQRALYAQPDAIVWGLDQANEAIEALQRQYPEINYVQGDVYDTGFPNESFDYVVAGEVIEHLDYPDRFTWEAFRILRKGGVLALSTPLNEAIEPGAVDISHIWSFDKQDIFDLVKEYSDKIKIKVLRSRYFPYKYSFPVLIIYCWKK